MTDMGPEVAFILFKQLDPEWKKLEREYESAFQAAAERLEDSRDSGSDRDLINKHRETLRKLRSANNLTEDMLRSEGEPALRELRDLFVIEIDEVLESSESLEALREKLLALTKERAQALNALPTEKAVKFEENDLLNLEEELTDDVTMQGNSDHLTVLAQNERIAGQVSAKEANGVRNLNELRMLAGLPPVALDPKLADASRGHSQDMKEHGFFAHESPLKGKTTPWDRAKLAGTSASGENIYLGSEDPIAANRAWFTSPGHHKNMFGNHSRAGMGNYGRHWTQMFGR